ncbi:unnamed protein product, partial [Cyprideis torosa]
IGLAIANELLLKGADVLIFSRSKGNLEQALTQLKIAVKQPNQVLEAISLDVVDHEQTVEVMQKAIEKFGVPQILINCVGMAQPKKFEDIAYADFERTIKTNLYSVWNISTAIVPYFKSQARGVLVHTSSIAGVLGVYGYSDYAMTKFGVIGFCEALRNELKPHNVKVQVICPPDTDTPGYEKENLYKPEETHAVSGNVKLMKPELVAKTVLKELDTNTFLIVPGLDAKLTVLAKRWLPRVVWWVIDSNTQLSAQSTEHGFAQVSNLKRDVLMLTNTEQPRNYEHPEVLDSLAAKIHESLAIHCDSVYYQTFDVQGQVYRNVIAIIGPKNAEKIVVGAHYDVAGNQDGADDNASGVAGLLELARLLSKETLNYQVEFVAYTLEEPPFFRTEYMGSYIHAKSLRDNGQQIKGMICLEMIGYYSDEEHSQDYPIGLLRWFYGNKGNFITLVQKFGGGSFDRQITRGMKSQNLIPTKSFKGPASLTGVDFSDHLNYWKFDYNALMITNTSFYRNKNYHQESDKIETLDFNRMALVVDELFLCLKQLK